MYRKYCLYYDISSAISRVSNRLCKLNLILKYKDVHTKITVKSCSRSYGSLVFLRVKPSVCYDTRTICNVNYALGYDVELLLSLTFSREVLARRAGNSAVILF